ncbi:hypothetical protein G6O67_000212 [Ophiocordyceps sinensis]|uniref:Uncharacterized protein n=1 Tax=Ophiocordyceps sinensis TaxID=72228 RepID=A0A8H4V9E8_9HYPO|nr:hypothetical protein G6O67_000212 [Ophiocordyceps sinensis]
MDGVRHCNPVRLERAPSGHAVARAQGSGLGEQEKRSQPSNTRMDGGKMKSSNAAPAAIHVDSVSLRYACVMTPGEIDVNTVSRLRATGRARDWTAGMEKRGGAMATQGRANKPPRETRSIVQGSEPRGSASCIVQ